MFLFVFLFAQSQTQTVVDSQNQERSINFKKDRNLWQTLTYDLGNIAGGMGYAYSRTNKQNYFSNYIFESLII